MQLTALWHPAGCVVKVVSNVCWCEISDQIQSSHILNTATHTSVTYRKFHRTFFKGSLRFMVKASINQLSVKCKERSVREDPVLRTSCKSNTSWRILVWNMWVAFRIPNACYLCIAFGEIRRWKLPTVTEGPWRGLLFIFSPMETLDTWLIIDCYSLKLGHANYYLSISSIPIPASVAWKVLHRPV